MNVLATLERILIAASDGTQFIGSGEWVETPYVPNAGAGTAQNFSVFFPPQPALWRQAVVDAIAAEAASRGNTVVRVVFQDLTTDKV